MNVTLLLAWACSFFIVLILMAISAAERAPINEELDGSAKGLTDAQARPEEAERPAIPKQIIVHLSVSDRLEMRETATPPELEALRRGLRKIRDREMVEKAIREVGGC